MGFLARLRGLLGGKGRSHKGGGSTFGGGDAGAHWIYVQCRRCGEPLRGRINLMNDPSLADDGETWIVRKGLIGSGSRRCFQTVEVMLHFDRRKQTILDSEAVGGRLITAEEYEVLLSQS